MKADTRMESVIAWVILLILGGWASAGVAANASEIDIDELLTETQKQTPDPDRLTYVWWMPEEFWRASMAGDPTVPEAALEEFLEVLRPYALFGIVDGTLGPLGGAEFIDPESVRASVILVDEEGREHEALEKRAVSADAWNFALMMRPVLAGIIGPTGENMAFCFFPAEVGDGTKTASTTRRSHFTIRVADERFEWKTPLGSVLPRKLCPVGDEELNGAWLYCPWHGAELVERDG